MPMTEFDTETLSKYDEWAKSGRRVVAIVNRDKEAIEFDGQLRAAHSRGIMIRPKGRMKPEMIHASELESLELFDYRPKPIESKVVPEATFGAIRQHLADRHGFALEDLNAPSYGENEAYDEHLKEHAAGSPAMSHFHRES